MKINFFLKNNKGFTLLETLVAVGLLMVAVVGPLTIAQKSLSSSYYTRDRITAYYLAQDAIEFVRSARDNASLGYPVPPQKSAWGDFQGVFLTCFTTNGCEFDTTLNNINLSSNAAVTECQGGLCRLMNYNKTTGWYNYSPISGDTLTGNQPSIFRRKINLVQSPFSPDEVQVKVTVSWRSAIFGPTERSFTLQDNLLNWQ